MPAISNQQSAIRNQQSAISNHHASRRLVHLLVARASERVDLVEEEDARPDALAPLEERRELLLSLAVPWEGIGRHRKASEGIGRHQNLLCLAVPLENQALERARDQQSAISNQQSAISTHHLEIKPSSGHAISGSAAAAAASRAATVLPVPGGP